MLEKGNVKRTVGMPHLRQELHLRWEEGVFLHIRMHAEYPPTSLASSKSDSRLERIRGRCLGYGIMGTGERELTSGNDNLAFRNPPSYNVSGGLYPYPSPTKLFKQISLSSVFPQVRV